MTLLCRKLGVLVLVLLAGCAVGTTEPPANVSPHGEVIHVTNETVVEYLNQTSNLEEGENPHTIRLENNGERTTTVRLYIVQQGTNETVFRESYQMASGATVTGGLNYEANYTVVVEQDGEDEVVELSRSMFDCNSSGTTFNITESGMKATTASTLAYCPMDPPGDD